MSHAAEQAIARIFADAAPRRFGTGWISGVLAVALGLLAVAAVLCLHFPQWLTLPELRARYPLPLVRTAIDVAILAVLALSAVSLLLRRRKALGLAGLALAATALALGAGGVEIGRAGESAVRKSTCRYRRSLIADTTTEAGACTNYGVTGLFAER